MNLFFQIQMREEFNYIFLHTRVEDIIAVFAGAIVFIVMKWGVDNKRFEKKIKHAKENPITFRHKYEQNPKYYANDPDWSWKIWWKDNDQNFIPSFIVAILSVLFIPEGFVAITGKEYYPFYSFLYACSPLAILEVIQRKIKKKIDIL